MRSRAAEMISALGLDSVMFICSGRGLRCVSTSGRPANSVEPDGSPDGLQEMVKQGAAPAAGERAVRPLSCQRVARSATMGSRSPRSSMCSSLS